MSVSVRQGRIQLFVNGVSRRCYGASATLGPDSPIAQCSLTINPEDLQLQPGDQVEVHMGYVVQGVSQVFRGEVRSDGLDFYPFWATARCTSELRRIDARILKEDTAASATPTTGIIVAEDTGP